MAAGKWVLHKSFLEDSRQFERFVNEEPHEWGTEIPGEQPNKLAMAARRWRIKLEETRKASKRKTRPTIFASI
jgi:topoisomerase (DNA) II binding protein 1